jgi:radical SAM superfamily enzyme YgiQ (UPF0313 family)
LLGLESGSEEILEKFNKRITINDQKRALAILEKYNIDTAVSYISFTPWSTLEQIEDTVKHFLSLKVNMIQGMLNRFQIYDGTPLAKELRKKGIVEGQYPNERYKTVDERVDLLYEIVNRNFNPYLYVAYRLKILERELRIVSFKAELNGISESVTNLGKYRLMYKDMMQKIMVEATAQFLDILGMIRNGVKIDEHLHGEVKEQVLKKTNNWFIMTEMFRQLCPELNS